MLPERLGEDAVAPLDTVALDSGLAGGLPRGQVSEVVGPASSGRTSVAWAALAAATRRGESVALIDTFDRFDPPTAHACGIDLSRLLWVRGQAVSKTSGAIDPAWLPGVRAVNLGSPSRVLGAMGLNGPGTFVERVIDRAFKSLNLVVQSGVCTLVVMDLIDVPANALRRLPASTWFRVERAMEGSDTAVLVLAAMPVARSAGGRSIVMSAGSREPGTGNRKDVAAPGARLPVPVWKGAHDRTRRIAGVHARANITAARSAHSHRVDVKTTVVNAV
ncbi:MAG: hypothetical protein ABI024_13360 [Vicinamibacterales bacterium]